MSTSVEIPPRLIRTVYRKGSGRNRPFEERVDYDNQADKRGVDPEDRHIVGLMGEMAFAIYANIEIDAELVEWTDGGIDFEVSIAGVEHTVDVKTSQKEPYALPVEEGRVKADYYVLGHLEDTTVTFFGAATKEVVLDRDLSETKYDHRNYQVPISSLEPIPDSESIVSV